MTKPVVTLEVLPENFRKLASEVVIDLQDKTAVYVVRELSDGTTRVDAWHVPFGYRELVIASRGL